MVDTVVHTNRLSVHEPNSDELEAEMTKLVDFVEANEPKILSYNVYFSADGDQMAVMHMR